MPLSGIRDYFSKRIAHDVKVYGTDDFSITGPHVFSSHRTVGTRPFAVRMNIQPPKVSSLRGKRQCVAKGFTFAEARVKVRGERVRCFSTSGLKARSVTVRLDKGSVKPKDGLELMLFFVYASATEIHILIFYHIASLRSISGRPCSLSCAG